MAIQGNFLFKDHGRAEVPSSGDGSAIGAATTPATGEANRSYEAPPVAPRMDTRGGLDSTLTRAGRGDELTTAYRSSAARHGGIDYDADSNESSCGVELGAEKDSFTTTGNPPSEFGGTTTGGSDRLVTHQSSLPPGTNEQSAGRIVI